MNKNRYQVIQDPTETNTDYITRIQNLESLAFDKNIFKDRAQTEGNKKFMINLKDVIRDEVKIIEIVKSFPFAEEVFLIDSNWSYISNMLKRKFGFNNPAITAKEYNLEINELLNEIHSGKSPIYSSCTYTWDFIHINTRIGDKSNKYNSKKFRSF